MNSERFAALTAAYSRLRVAIVGDFCLDRYFDIDPARMERSIETGREVHNIVRTRCQPGGAGTILNNLAALGVAEIAPIGFCGDDGEGWELQRALKARPGVRLDGFLPTIERRTFTYTKPLVHRPNQPPEELDRLDIKNWTPTPAAVRGELAQKVRALASQVDAMILLDQVDVAGTGVITPDLLAVIDEVRRHRPMLPILADSRRGLKNFPPVIFKMNRAELAALTGKPTDVSLEDLKQSARELAARNQQPVVITLAEDGMLGATHAGDIAHVPALPLRGPIDIVGAGDAVTANLTAALTAGANLTEALTLASVAASIVIHQLGTTGTASVAQLKELLTSDN